MSRPLVLLLALAGGAAAAPAPPAGTARVLDVEPAGPPTPVLKFQLLPELTEMNPGNAIPAYLRSFGEQSNFFFTKEPNEERERLLKCPLSEIKPGSLKGYGGTALWQADHAARLEYADWNLLPQIREKGYFLLLPDIQQLRTLANALAVRGRGQLVDKDYAGAISTIKTILALGRHLGDHPTLICSLVGMAVTHIGLNLVEELVQQPGAPNLYWALTALPTPLVDTRKAVSGERMMQDVGFGPQSDPARVWVGDDIAAGLQKAKEIVGMNELSPADRAAAGPWVAERLKDEAWLAAGRKALAAHGSPADKVAKYPAEQVLVFKFQLDAQSYRDEALKWMPVPYWQAADALAELEAVKPADIEGRLVRVMGVAVGKVKGAQARLDQRIALLRAAEAIRLDAAKTGELPAKLSDLTVPVPDDPATGRRFEYKPDKRTAELAGKVIGTTSTSYAKYEVRVRQK